MQEKPFIILIEDDFDLREILTEGLRQITECEIAAASNCPEGLQIAFRADEIALFVLDMFLGKINGDECLFIMDGDPKLENVPRLIISAMPEAAFSEWFQKFEMNNYRWLEKPFEMEEFLKICKSCCRFEHRLHG